MNDFYPVIKKELIKASNTIVFSLWEAESEGHTLNERREPYITAIVNKQITISLLNMLYCRGYITEIERTKKISQLNEIIREFQKKHSNIVVA